MKIRTKHTCAIIAEHETISKLLLQYPDDSLRAILNSSPVPTLTPHRKRRKRSEKNPNASIIISTMSNAYQSRWRSSFRVSVVPSKWILLLLLGFVIDAMVIRADQECSAQGGVCGRQDDNSAIDNADQTAGGEKDKSPITNDDQFEWTMEWTDDGWTDDGWTNEPFFSAWEILDPDNGADLSDEDWAWMRLYHSLLTGNNEFDIVTPFFDCPTYDEENWIHSKSNDDQFNDDGIIPIQSDDGKQWYYDKDKHEVVMYVDDDAFLGSFEDASVELAFEGDTPKLVQKDKMPSDGAGTAPDEGANGGDGTSTPSRGADTIPDQGANGGDHTLTDTAGKPTKSDEADKLPDEGAYSIPDDETWKLFEKAYNWAVGAEAIPSDDSGLSLNPSAKSFVSDKPLRGMTVPFEVKYDEKNPALGRGVYATTFIPKGTTLWIGSHTVGFTANDPKDKDKPSYFEVPTYRRFLEYLNSYYVTDGFSRDKDDDVKISDADKTNPVARHNWACDVLMWTFSGERRKDVENNVPAVCVAFDHGSLFNDSSNAVETTNSLEVSHALHEQPPDEESYGFYETTETSTVQHRYHTTTCQFESMKASRDIQPGEGECLVSCFVANCEIVCFLPRSLTNYLYHVVQRVSLQLPIFNRRTIK